MQYSPFATTEKNIFFHLKKILEKTFFANFFGMLWLKYKEREQLRLSSMKIFLLMIPQHESIQFDVVSSYLLI